MHQMRAMADAADNSATAGAPRATGLQRALTGLVLLLVLGVAFSFAFTPLRSSQDEWWHLKAGKWIVENGRLPRNDIFTYTGENMRWHNHEWLAQVLFYGVHQLGEAGAHRRRAGAYHLQGNHRHRHDRAGDVAGVDAVPQPEPGDADRAARGGHVAPHDLPAPAGAVVPAVRGLPAAALPVEGGQAARGVAVGDRAADGAVGEPARHVPDRRGGGRDHSRWASAWRRCWSGGAAGASAATATMAAIRPAGFIPSCGRAPGTSCCSPSPWRSP